jgi:hypothetical protein
VQKRWSTTDAVWEAASAVGVDEAEHGGSALGPGSRVEGDRLAASRLADGLNPLFPFVWVLWLLVGVEQQFPAERAAPSLPLE